MQKCIYKNKAIYAFDIFGENETIKNDLEKEIRKASANCELFCDECGKPVIFRYGKIREPHFSHKKNIDSNSCSYGFETEEHIEGKKLLYKYMKKLYPDAFVEIRHKFEKKRIADIYIKFINNKELVIEFHRNNLSVKYWDEKRDFYKSLNIKNIWFLNQKELNIDFINREKELNMHDRMALNDIGQLLILDVDNKQVIVCKKIEIFNDNKKVYDQIFSLKYRLDDIVISEEGLLICDFEEKFILEKSKIEEEIMHHKLLDEKRIIQKSNNIDNFTQLSLINNINDNKIIENKKIEVKRKSFYERFNIEINNNIQEKSSITTTGKSKEYKDKYSYYNKHYYEKLIDKILYGDENEIKKLINIMHSGSSAFYEIETIFKQKIKNGNKTAEKIYREILIKAGLD